MPLRTLFAATVALAAWTSTAALAEPAGPVELTDAQMDWVSAGFAGSADDPFFFDIPGVIRERINPQTAAGTAPSGGTRVANPGVNVPFVPLDLDDVQNLFESR